MVAVDGEYISAEAGASNKNVVKAGHEKGLVGMEFLAWIPGSVGGAVVMNAGAHGGEVKQFLTEVEVMGGDFKTSMIDAKDLDLAYRSSNLQEQVSISRGRYFGCRAETWTRPKPLWTSLEGCVKKNSLWSTLRRAVSLSVRWVTMRPAD